MINFYKYHGAGNDFIMINNLKGEVSLKTDYIKSICDRHMGIGADGVILLEASDKADCFMNYYNSDGTIAQMCGNGARCTAKFFLEQLNVSKARSYSINIDTRAGIKNIIINSDDTYSVNMGAPVFESPDFPPATSLAYGEMTILKIEGLDFSCVSMGNPHAVTIVDDVNKIDLKTIGSRIENNENFPNKINVEFVEKISDNHYKVKVWERGCGETLACGTGACAVFVILNKLSARKVLAEKEVALEFPGGKLYLSENREGLNQSKGLDGRTSQDEVLGQIILRGPATFVFKGEIIL